MLYKAVIFDLDGTLLDTLEDIGNAVNRVLAERGFSTHAIDAYRYFVGDGSRQLVRRALAERGQDENTVQECFDAFMNDYAKNWNIKTKLYSGIPELLNELTLQGMTLAVLTNKPQRFAEQCVRKLLPKWPFKAVIGQRDEANRKPDPSGALEISQKLHIPPEDFLFLGDSAVDMKTAIAASMFPVGVLWGFRTAEELRESGARALISRPEDLYAILGFQPK